MGGWFNEFDNRFTAIKTISFFKYYFFTHGGVKLLTGVDF